MTPDTKLSSRAGDNHTDPDHDLANKSDLLDDEEDFFDFITRSVILISFNISLTMSHQVPVQEDG